MVRVWSARALTRLGAAIDADSDSSLQRVNAEPLFNADPLSTALSDTFNVQPRPRPIGREWPEPPDGPDVPAVVTSDYDTGERPPRFDLELLLSLNEEYRSKPLYPNPPAYDEEMIEIYRRYTKLRVTLQPYITAAAAQAAGFRACKRCLPDATPGSPDWDVRAGVTGRAMRLIADGLVDREGVSALAARLGYSSRQLGRILTAELGAGPLALARARRAQIARVLIETTDLRLAEVAFAAGFSSVRQFNDTVREVYAASPTELRGRRSHTAAAGEIRLNLAVRTPFALPSAKDPNVYSSPSNSTRVPASVVATVRSSIRRRGTNSGGPIAEPKRVTISPGATPPPT